MIHYLKAFFLVAMAGNAIALLFLKLPFDLAIGSIPTDKRLGAAAIAVSFAAFVSIVIWALRKKLPDGEAVAGKKAYRVMGIGLFILVILLGTNEALTASTLRTSDKYFLGAGLLIGAYLLERVSPWLRLH